MKHIYYCIGRMIEICQQIEVELKEAVYYAEIVKEYIRNPYIDAYNFEIVVLSAEYLQNKMETMTLGQLIGVVYDTRCLNKRDVNSLRYLLERRNYFVHEYFKYTPIGQILSDPAQLKDEIDALKDMVYKMEAMHGKAINSHRKYRNMVQDVPLELRQKYPALKKLH